MKTDNIQEIENITNSLLPDKTARQKSLIVFSEAIKQAHFAEKKNGVFII